MPGWWVPCLFPFQCLYRDRVAGSARNAVVTFEKKFPRQNQLRFHFFTRFQGEGDGERGWGTARVTSNSRGCQRDLLVNVGREARGQGVPDAHRCVLLARQRGVSPRLCPLSSQDQTP